MGGFGLGVGVSPVNLLPGLHDQPTGPELVSLLERDHIDIVRLVGETPTSMPWEFAQMHDGGWREVFGELEKAHIDVILLVGGEAGIDGIVDEGYWPPEPTSPDPAPGQRVESTHEWIANQEAIYSDIKAQCGGVPWNLVAVEAANEPLMNPSTIPMLKQDIAAIRGEFPGVPVTLAGWRVGARHPGERWDYNNAADAPLVVPLVDYVTAHMYLDSVPELPNGASDRQSTDPSVYVGAAEVFIDQVLAVSRGKPVFIGEFGGVDGRPQPVATSPSGGSPEHQSAVIEASDKAMASMAPKGVTGGTLWLLEQMEGRGFPCTPLELVCFDKPVMPALSTLARDAARYDR